MTAELLDVISTPSELARVVVQQACCDLPPRSEVLEPSAGCGALALAVAELKHIPYCIEKDMRQLERLLHAFQERFPNKPLPHTQQGDFLKIRPFDGRLFHAVVMFPPISDNQYTRHIQKAFQCLRPGGKLIALIPGEWHELEAPRGPLFQAWVEAVGADWSMPFENVGAPEDPEVVMCLGYIEAVKKR